MYADFFAPSGAYAYKYAVYLCILDALSRVIFNQIKLTCKTENSFVEK